MNKHPHEEVILAYFRRQQVQQRQNDGSPWKDVRLYNENTVWDAPVFLPRWQYRIKPEPTCKLELTKSERDELWWLFQHHGHHANTSGPLESIRRKIQAVEYTE